MGSKCRARNFSVKEADLDDLQFLIEDLQDADYQFEVVNIGCGGTGKLEVLENGLFRNCPARPQLPQKWRFPALREG